MKVDDAMNMKYMSRRLGLLGALSIVALSGCEYFGGDRSQRGLNDGNPPTEVRVTGVVQASGPVNTASIRVFKVENGLKGERLAEGPTAEDGRFIVGFADNAYRGPVLVEASGGTFVDQSTGQTRTLQTDLRLAIPDTNSLRDGVVSPLSTIAVEAAERSTGGFTSTSIQAAINQVNALFGGTLDLGAFDQLPDDPNFPELREQALKVSDPADTTSTVTPSA